MLFAFVQFAEIPWRAEQTPDSPRRRTSGFALISLLGNRVNQELCEEIDTDSFRLRESLFCKRSKGIVRFMRDVLSKCGLCFRRAD